MPLVAVYMNAAKTSNTMSLAAELQPFLFGGLLICCSERLDSPMLNCMIFWQTPHALDIYRSVHFVILQNGTTGGLMCWICDIFSRNASGFLQNKCWQTRCRWVSAWKKNMFYSTNFQLTNLKGADWCWLMVVGDWWPGIEFFFHWFISTFQPLCFVFSLHLYFFWIFCCMFCLVSSLT